MARLPQPGGDAGSWGQILNEFLSQSHAADGTLKPNVVNETALGTGGGSDGQVLVKDSAAASGMSWQSAVSGTVSDATTTQRGVVQLTGDLSGTATAPTVPGLANKADTNHTHAVANVTGLQAALDAKLNTAQVGVANGVASLDGAGRVPSAQLPTFAAVASSGAYTDLTGQPTIPAQFSPVAGTNVTITGTYPNLTFSATPGAGVTDLSTTTTGSNVTVVSSTGNDAVIAGATVSAAGVLTAADKTKLDGVAIGATANSSDVFLRDRANHTGAQAIATVTGLQTALDGKAATTHAHAAADIASGVVAPARLGTGTTDATTVLYGDGTWKTAPSGGGSVAWNIRHISTAGVAAATDNDWIIANPAAGSITVALPAPVANAHVRVKRNAVSGNSILITTPNGGMLDGGEPTMATLNAGWSSQDYESDGTNWFTV